MVVCVGTHVHMHILKPVFFQADDCVSPSASVAHQAPWLARGCGASFLPTFFLMARPPCLPQDWENSRSIRVSWFKNGGQLCS